MTTDRTRAEIEAEIETTFGFLPSCFKQVPDRRLDAEWRIFKTLKAGCTRVPKRDSGLVCLALRSITLTERSLVFHTEVARLLGATEAEIQNALDGAIRSLCGSIQIDDADIDHEEFVRQLKEIDECVSRLKTMESAWGGD